ncbi:MAG: prolipoprotein diacylglyceryl transferase [Firmicutes bacterium HGW-Firmicutes-19]|jgi:phosphatidylglycerol:prolipoprotein diacylglycerol transferase|nr:MAG: prolipoprotein diacylglyceryl transferase [Firmicutes bacterium HGW-Firmicutes-19]
MKFFPDLQTFMDIGPISIKWYAVLILAGAYLAYYLSFRNLKKMGYKSDLTDDLFFGALLSGVIGARLWFVLFFDLNYYLSRPLEIFMTWQGGLAIQGGLFGGVLFGLWFVKRKKLNFMRFADAIVPNILVAQAIGRWGNFLNQEAYGRVVQESFYNGWPQLIKNQMFIAGQFREPTFLYESAANIVGFLLIAVVLKKFSKPKRGDMVYAYLMWYGVTRFFIEGLRSDSLMFMGLRSAQLVSIAFIIIGVLGTLGVFRKLLKKEKPVILFDFDGTLMDTEPAIIESFKQVFGKYAPDTIITREMELSFLGPTLWETFKKYLPEEDADKLVEEYRIINFEMHKTHVKPMEGAKELLTGLKEQGYKIGIVSSKLTDAIDLGLNMFEMKDYFDVVIGLEQVKKHKPDPEGLFEACKKLNIGHDSAIYIGDTQGDVLAGINAGMFTIAYATDQERKDMLDKLKPTRLISSLSEINDVLKEDVEWTYSTM